MRRDKDLEKLISGVVSQEIDVKDEVQRKALGRIEEESMLSEEVEEIDEARTPRETIDRRYRLHQLRHGQRKLLDPAAKAKGPMSDKKKAAIEKQGKIDKKLERSSGRTTELYSKYHTMAELENHKNHKEAAHEAAADLGGKKIHEDDHGTTYVFTSSEHSPIMMHIKPARNNNTGRHDINIVSASGSSYHNSDVNPSSTITHTKLEPATKELHKAKISGALAEVISSAKRNRSTGWE